MNRDVTLGAQFSAQMLCNTGQRGQLWHLYFLRAVIFALLLLLPLRVSLSLWRVRGWHSTCDVCSHTQCWGFLQASLHLITPESWLNRKKWQQIKLTCLAVLLFLCLIHCSHVFKLSTFLLPLRFSSLTFSISCLFPLLIFSLLWSNTPLSH